MLRLLNLNAKRGVGLKMERPLFGGAKKEVKTAIGNVISVQLNKKETDSYH